MNVAKAFVRIKNYSKRVEVFEIIRKGRISLEGNKQSLRSDYILINKNRYALMQFHNVHCSAKKHIDCNAYTDTEEDAIRLFLSLSKCKTNIEITKILKEYE